MNMGAQTRCHDSVLPRSQRNRIEPNRHRTKVSNNGRSRIGSMSGSLPFFVNTGCRETPNWGKCRYYCSNQGNDLIRGNFLRFHCLSEPCWFQQAKQEAHQDWRASFTYTTCYQKRWRMPTLKVDGSRPAAAAPFRLDAASLRVRAYDVYRLVRLDRL